MTPLIVLVVIVIAIALVFDFLNGFHDAANSIATIVVARTLTPIQAVCLAGFANFVGYFAFGTAVASTIGKGVVHIEKIGTPELTLTVVLSALVGAILWNILTWLLGLPTSSSHALIGGLIGSGIAAAGPKVVILGGFTQGKFIGVLPIFGFIIVAPVLGLLTATIITTVVLRLSRKAHPTRALAFFKKLQLFSATSYSIGHGTNDAQKTMGIIALALFASGINKSFRLDGWVVLSCYCAIGLGTMFGGWRIVKTMGTKITKIRSVEGFCAESSAATVLMTMAHVGMPVSTTHVISGAIMGVGTVEHAAKVRWITARKILWAWLLTIPVTAVCGALSLLVLRMIIVR